MNTVAILTNGSRCAVLISPAFAQAAGLSADPQPYVVKHAQGTASIKAHQESQYTAGDLALAKAARAAP